MYKYVYVISFTSLKLRELTLRYSYKITLLHYFILEQHNFMYQRRNVPQSIPADPGWNDLKLQSFYLNQSDSSCYSENLRQDLASLIYQVVGSSTFQDLSDLLVKDLTSMVKLSGGGKTLTYKSKWVFEKQSPWKLNLALDTTFPLKHAFSLNPKKQTPKNP